ncbi:putative ribonuclease H-like domain-containing protein [Tanacetum coccineum]
MKELQHFNLFSVSQIYDKKNKVLFTDSECLVLSPEFKLLDANQVLLRIPKQNNMYSFNLENIVPSRGLACLIAKATIDESNKWHRRLGHKGKQHKASCKAKSVSSISQPLQLLHMDLFSPTSVRRLNHKTYCLVITDDFSRFIWVFFLRTKDETNGILKDFIRQIENQLNQKVKTIRCDNGTKFKNRDFIEFCGSKGIKREYSNARTPQQNGVAERKNRTFIEAARTMLADSFLPNTFWAEAVSTACYVLNRVLVTKPQNKTPYELVTGKGPTWLFDLDYLTDSMNYQPVRSENQANKHAGPQEANQNAGTEDNIDAGDSEIEAESAQDYFVLPIWSSYTSTVKSSKANNAGEEPTKHPDFQQVDKEDQVFLDELERLKRQEQDANDAAEALRKEFAQETEDLLLQAGAAKASSTNIVNTASTPVSTASPYGGLSFTDLTNTDQDDSEIPALEEIYDNPTDGIFTNSSYDDEGAVADFTNLEPVVNVSPIPTSRINSIHPLTLILRDPQSAVQTRSKVDAMQEELLQFKIQKVWILIDLPYGKKAIGTKWVNPKTSHLSVVKRIFRYLKGKPKLGLWYPRVSSFDLEAYSDSYYAGANLDRKSTTGGCQFLGRRLISWKCKKQTIVATSTTEAEYVAAANCCGQNPIFHSKTKHIAIRHHFIRDAYEKKLIQVLKIHTDDNVADLLTKAFDDSRGFWWESWRSSSPVKIPFREDGDMTTLNLDKECLLEAKIGGKEVLEEIVDAKGVYMGRSRFVVHSEKEREEKEVSTDDALGTDKEKDSTDKKKIVPIDQVKVLKDEVLLQQLQHLLLQILVMMRLLLNFSKDYQKIKAKEIEEEDESDTESEGIPEAEKKFKQLVRDEEMARKVQEDWEAEEEVKKLAEEEAIKAALSNEYDFIQARIEADRLLALRLQDEERESSSLWKREQNSFMIQFQLKEGILQNKELLQMKERWFDESFTTVGSTKDERKIKEMNEGAKDLEQKRLKKKVAKETPKKEDTTKVPAKVDVTEQGIKKRKGGHIKMLARKRKRPQSDVDNDDEHKKCLNIVTFKGTIDSEIMKRKSVITRLNKVSSLDRDYLVIYRANGNFKAFNYLLELNLWGDLKIMMESSKEENDQKLKDGTVIHILVERRYPLSKDLMQRMLDFGLEVEIESIVALDLIKFIKQQIGEE